MSKTTNPMFRKKSMLGLIPILFSGLLACSNHSTPYREIDLSDEWMKEEHFPLSEIAKTVRYIPLETNKACFFSASRSGLIVSENYFYLIPWNKPLLIFRKTGEFRGSVGSIGQGPREVERIGSVVVNEKKNWIAIFNSAHASVLLHTYEGELIREFPVDKSITRLIPGPDGQLIGLSIDIQDQTIGDSRLIFLEPTGQEIKRLEMYKTSRLKERLVMSDGLKMRWLGNDQLAVFESPFDRYYIRYKSGEWALYPFIKAGNMGVVDGIGFMKDYCLITAHNPTVQYFVASMVTGEVTHCSTLIDMAGGPDLTGMINDLDGGLPFWPKQVGGDQQMFSIYDASTIIDYAQSNLSYYSGTAPEMESSFKQMAATLSHEDNPVVVVVTLK
jgi:hypothetical protein